MVSRTNSRFYESSDSSDSDSDENLLLGIAGKRTPGFYILQCRAAMKGREVDWCKLLQSLALLAQKSPKNSAIAREDLCVASQRLCAQIEQLMLSEEFPQDRKTRRRILNASQAKASIALHKKYNAYLETIREATTRIAQLLPDELYHPSASSTLDALERFFIQDPLASIPIELLNTFNLVNSLSQSKACIN